MDNRAIKDLAQFSPGFAKTYLFQTVLAASQPEISWTVGFKHDPSGERKERNCFALGSTYKFILQLFSAVNENYMEY